MSQFPQADFEFSGEEGSENLDQSSNSSYQQRYIQEMVTLLLNQIEMAQTHTAEQKMKIDAISREIESLFNCSTHQNETLSKLEKAGQPDNCDELLLNQKIRNELFEEAEFALVNKFNFRDVCKCVSCWCVLGFGQNLVFTMLKSEKERYSAEIEKIDDETSQAQAQIEELREELEEKKKVVKLLEAEIKKANKNK